MLRVALTGGMGSGKTTASEMFQQLGCFVSQSDEVARDMMRPGQPVYRSIVQRFGPAVLRDDGSLNRTALADIAFTQDRAEDLNRIVHPAVIAAQTEWVDRIGAQDPHAIAIVESALVFETRHGSAQGGSTPWRVRFDRIILVTAPQELRIQRYVDRYIARSGASTNEGRIAAEADARARMRLQMPEEQKAALSDWVIYNDGSLDNLREQVGSVYQKLRAEAEMRDR